MAKLIHSPLSDKGKAKISYLIPLVPVTFKAVCLDLIQHKVLSRQVAYTLHNLLLMDANMRKASSIGHDGRYFLCTSDHVVKIWKRCFPWEGEKKRNRTYSIPTIERHLAKLIELGFIDVARQRRKNGMRTVRINYYAITSSCSNSSVISVPAKNTGTPKPVEMRETVLKNGVLCVLEDEKGTPENGLKGQNDGSNSRILMEPTVNNKNNTVGGAPPPGLGQPTNGELKSLLENAVGQQFEAFRSNPKNRFGVHPGYCPTHCQRLYMTKRNIFDEQKRGKFGDFYRFKGKGLSHWKLFFSTFCEGLNLEHDENNFKTQEELTRFLEFAYQKYGRFDLDFLRQRLPSYFMHLRYEAGVKVYKMFDHTHTMRMVPLTLLSTRFPSVFENTEWLVTMYRKYARLWERYTGRSLNPVSDKVVADYMVIACEKLAPNARDSKHLGELFLIRLRAYKQFEYFSARCVAFDFPVDKQYD